MLGISICLFCNWVKHRMPNVTEYTKLSEQCCVLQCILALNVADPCENAGKEIIAQSDGFWVSPLFSDKYIRLIIICLSNIYVFPRRAVCRLSLYYRVHFTYLLCIRDSVGHAVPTISFDLSSLIYICVFTCIQKLWIKYLCII